MSATRHNEWAEANQRYLRAALEEVAKALDRHAARAKGGIPNSGGAGRARPPDREATAENETVSALQILCTVFGLSSFEREVLLLCAGMELDAGFAERCAAAQSNPDRRYPTFGLALAALSDPHWSGLSPGGPLRYMRLIEVGNGAGLVQSPLRIDERILHYLTGVQHLDQRLEGFVRPVEPFSELVPSYQKLAERVAGAWSRPGGSAPAVHLRGSDLGTMKAIALHACAQVGFGLWQVSAHHLPIDARELGSLLRLWEREALLGSYALFLACEESDSMDAARLQTVQHFIDAARPGLIVGGEIRRSRSGRPRITLEVGAPTAAEQRSLWLSALGEAAAGLDGDLDYLVTQHRLTPSSIHAAAREALDRQEPGDKNRADAARILREYLSEACRVQARSSLSALAQRIIPAAGWDDLVLPQPQIKVLREIGIHVRQRMKVYEDWGFAAKTTRGLGISSLFAGSSGTGKTMAAEVLAKELGLDLFRIDLSQVVSKYIGETEKNLRRVFDAAEEGSAILLFDEADALFGKRSEVKDSHDRYANIEISYLLQRMESYHGLAILTTNMKKALDKSFSRRLRFIVQFPFPDAEGRAEIWRRIFPAETPLDGLDIGKLAQLNVAGGVIRNIAMNAAFLAAEANQAVGMTHILGAARTEYAKLEKPLTQSEVRGWM